MPSNLQSCSATMDSYNVQSLTTDEVALIRGKFFNKLTSKLNSKDVIEDSEFVNLITIVIYDNSNYVKRGDETKGEILNVLNLIDKRLNE